MNKGELVSEIAKESDLTLEQSKKALDAILNTIEATLKEDDDVVLVGFGSFSVKHKAERKGRNPATGEIMTLKATSTPSFKAGIKLKRALNS